MSMVTIDQAKCIDCAKCVADCVAGVLHLEQGKARYQGPCIRCGHCVAVCPANAVAIPAYEMEDVEEWRDGRFELDAAQLLRTIKFRRSIRHYQARPIEPEKLNIIIQAGRYTATGANSQGSRFIVVQEQLEHFKEQVWQGIREMLADPPAEFSKSALQSFAKFLEMRDSGGIDYLFRDAPAALLIAANSDVDAGLAAQNVELAALAQGLGALYNGLLVYAVKINPALCEWLEIKDKPIAVALLLGYPDVKYQRTAPRRAADVCWR